MRNRKGFTLIELLITLAIMSILTAITLNYYFSYQLRERDTQRKSEVASIQSALEQYKSANAVFAPDLGLTSCDSSPDCGSGNDNSGLGNNFYVVDFSGNLSGLNDPFFDTTTMPDGSTAPGYLLNYLERPKQVTALSIPANETTQFYGYSAKYSLSTGEINYRAQNNYYLIRTVIENTDNACTNNFADSGAWSSGGNNTGWINATYPVDANTNCGSKAEIYQVTSNLF